MLTKLYTALKDIPLEWGHPGRPRDSKAPFAGPPQPIGPIPTHVMLDGDKVEVKVYPERFGLSRQCFVCPKCQGERTRLWRFDD